VEVGGGAGAVEDVEAGESEGEEDGARLGQLVLELEQVGAVAALADAVEAEGWLDVEDDEDVGRRGEGVELEQVRGVEAAGALVGDGRQVVAIDDDDLVGGEGRLDEVGDVLPAPGTAPCAVDRTVCEESTGAASGQ
jgi:hypothetical protein